MPEIHFILVEPAVSENIGSAARALKTMGFSKLILVEPKGFPSKKARIVAHGATDVLRNARVCKSLPEALEGIDLSIGTASRNRSTHYDYHHVDEVKNIVQSKGKTIKSVGLVFGREESGLSNEELALCHLLSYLPAKTSHPSLNLAQAVMVYAYLFSEPELTEPVQSNILPQEPEYATLREKASDILIGLGFEPTSNIYNRFMERIACAGETDVHLMLSLINKLNERL